MNTEAANSVPGLITSLLQGQFFCLEKSMKVVLIQVFCHQILSHTHGCLWVFLFVCVRNEGVKYQSPSLCVHILIVINMISGKKKKKEKKVKCDC